VAVFRANVVLKSPEPCTVHETTGIEKMFADESK
jgi:hypothetical protein